MSHEQGGGAASGSYPDSGGSIQDSQPAGLWPASRRGCFFGAATAGAAAAAVTVLLRVVEAPAATTASPLPGDVDATCTREHHAFWYDDIASGMIPVQRSPDAHALQQSVWVDGSPEWRC